MKLYFTIASILLFFDICSGASRDNTTIPPAPSIKDNYGNIWTLNTTLGYVYLNGVRDTGSSNVVQLYWHNHTSYTSWYGSQPGELTQTNTQSQYFKFLGNISGVMYWIPCVDPSLGGTSVDGTTVANGTTGYIIDKSCNKWTLSNGYIYAQGPTDTSATKNPYASNVAQLLWYAGLIYHQGTGGQYYVQSFLNSGDWLACTDPRIAKAPHTGSFYGVNGHNDYLNPPFSPSNTVSILKSLGATLYRMNVETDTISTVVSFAKAFQSAGLKLFPVIDFGLYSNYTDGILYTSESAAYRNLRPTYALSVPDGLQRR